MTDVRSRSTAPTRFRARGVGAACAVVAFLGTAAAAPFSVGTASAFEGEAMAFNVPSHQVLAPETAEPNMDLSVSETERESGGDDSDTDGERLPLPSGALYTLDEFMFTGAVHWGGYKFTFYSQQVLPGPGLQIPGRHVNEAGYVSDEDGYIVLAGSAPKGTVYETPFGYPGKIYDRGTVGTHLDVYIR